MFILVEEPFLDVWWKIPFYSLFIAFYRFSVGFQCSFGVMRQKYSIQMNSVRPRNFWSELRQFNYFTSWVFESITNNFNKFTYKLFSIFLQIEFSKLFPPRSMELEWRSIKLVYGKVWLNSFEKEFWTFTVTLPSFFTLILKDGFEKKELKTCKFDFCI